ncbi:MAG: hypothetical protein GQ539_15920 [Sulfitobacter sp.]|nr:hypothetical protein [Sulfitobacter sp.]
MQDHGAKKRGVLLRANNGDVIGFDETGLRMNLSDSVIEDIHKRLPALGGHVAVDPAVLGDVDAWHLRQDGKWFVFGAHLPGAQGPRQFRRRVQVSDDASAPDIIADTAGAVYGLLSFGGTRRAVTANEPLSFPYHVVTTGDDLGPAGASGTQTNEATDVIQRLTEQTRDSLIADEILRRRQADHRALPLIYARCETDSASGIAALSQGAAFDNLRQTVQNLCDAARSLGKPAKVLSVGLDFTLEDVTSSGPDWAAGIHRMMHQITDLFADHGLRKPLFTAIFDAGTADISDSPVLRAQWDLAWNKGDHDHVFAAPGYMFAQDVFGRATPDARLQMAEMESCAIEARNSDAPWACPVLLLAERENDTKVIRCRGEAMGALILDKDDPLNAGKACGFRFEGDENGAKIIDVRVDSKDRNDLLITCDKPPKGATLTLCYALGHPASDDGMPANRGALRDGFKLQSATGQTLYRWALPAALPVH